MRVVIQRVKKASVTINKKVVGQINDGLLVLFAVQVDDLLKDVDWLVKKIARLRIFTDSDGKLNKSITDINGSVLVVSQFTLYGDCSKGNRPSFTKSAPPEKAKEYYEKFVEQLRSLNIKTETGRFREHMKVELINDGPTTIILDSSK
ncbi:D-tyrosyl-tRNA(Tyr) deacylase [Candidatus Falkowbacteria bacterium CG10_big_fil_rev_8_21_14_0_10_37_6]|uniref:D-aminoacyl-tRNA deacylase n=1 Tax=Candidatus Falkowbacteria bacterium CG10_big_fil_rev_8_21_14_0_10_37_6 TaxID=1974563 RepID=A0A2H0V7R3_9BACT|nr:MAG: D-tyrosyl-tRNA(Tyr) deacylase [Candidatus Falkowbacteria bacterium CG10_big_fil_rev_8_21_14_0_10_37_6]